MLWNSLKCNNILNAPSQINLRLKYLIALFFDFEQGKGKKKVIALKAVFSFSENTLLKN